MISYPRGVRGVRTRVLEAGRSGPAILLLHGVGARADRWRENVDPLAAAGHHVYAVDLPGHGFADKGADFDYSVAGWSDFVEAFLDDVKADPVVLIGTSLGGHIAASVACRRPDAVRALVLVGSLGLLPVGVETRERMRGGIVNMTRDGLRQKMLRVNFDPARVTEEALDEEFGFNNSPGAAAAFAKIAAYFGDRLDADAVGDRLAKLTPRIPTLLVWGAQEQSVAVSVGEGAHRALPGSRLVLIDGAAHGPYVEKPKAFNAVVLDFLAGRLGTYQAPDVTYR
jgi:2-hydroxy-6-oxonona-2,4-dienedioate hydrolase